MVTKASWKNLATRFTKFVRHRFGCHPHLRHLGRRAAQAGSLDQFRGELQGSPLYPGIGEPLLAEIESTYARFLFRPPTPGEVVAHLSHFYERFGSLKACRRAVAEGNVRAHLNIRPFKLEMDITNQCNLRCVMCYFSDERVYKRKREDISVADFARIAEQIFPLCERVSLSIATEPLLHNRFEELLAITRRHEVPLVYMNTNGLLLNEKRIDAIVRSGMHQLSVSIDGATAPTYERIRVGSNFERVVANLRALNRAKRRRGTKLPHLNFNFVLMRSNIRELPALIRLAHELGVEGVAATHVVRYENTNTADESLESDRELCDRMLDEARELAQRLKVGVNFPANFGTPSLPPLIQVGRAYFDLEIAKEEEARPCCPFPWHFIGIDCYGKVLPCGWWYHPEQPMGDLRTDSFEAIWNNERYRALRAEHLSGKQRATCRSCPAAGMGPINNSSAFEVKSVSRAA